MMGVLFSGCIASKQENVIRTFFGLIDKKRVSEAVSMMSEKMVSNEEIRQQWMVQFDNFESVKVEKIEKSVEENMYKVELTVKINSRTTDKLIPDYGFGNKTEIRFIKLIKDSQGQWKIEGIATGP